MRFAMFMVALFAGFVLAEIWFFLRDAWRSRDEDDNEPR